MASAIHVTGLASSLQHLTDDRINAKFARYGPILTIHRWFNLELNRNLHLFIEYQEVTSGAVAQADTDQHLTDGLVVKMLHPGHPLYSHYLKFQGQPAVSQWHPAPDMAALKEQALRWQIQRITSQASYEARPHAQNSFPPARESNTDIFATSFGNELDSTSNHHGAIISSPPRAPLVNPMPATSPNKSAVQSDSMHFIVPPSLPFIMALNEQNANSLRDANMSATHDQATAQLFAGISGAKSAGALPPTSGDSFAPSDANPGHNDKPTASPLLEPRIGSLEQSPYSYDSSVTEVVMPPPSPPLSHAPPAEDLTDQTTAPSMECQDDLHTPAKPSPNHKRERSPGDQTDPPQTHPATQEDAYKTRCKMLEVMLITENREKMRLLGEQQIWLAEKVLLRDGHAHLHNQCVELKDELKGAEGIIQRKDRELAKWKYEAASLRNMLLGVRETLNKTDDGAVLASEMGLRWIEHPWYLRL
ncbi:hypothetical protein BOTBODRAFT_170173 [Botryobasidium botryosum FD-172 SS1]|uniref:Uncharacterized protein n=1 Tax=Botryobasidium botryosum (strain FD-172 SS1) TaxID=930990 RepID=A0A067N7Q8_BOTB1|nr:hypothetical protein BOTBODRAFT_170173 [Botryobasidium botryosum FD-172 SS1]